MLPLDPGNEPNEELPIDDFGFALEMHERAATLADDIRRRDLQLNELQRRVEKLGVKVTPIDDVELFRIARQVAWQRIQAKGYWRGLPGYCGLVLRGKLALACLRWHLDLRTCYAAPKAKAA